MAVGQSFPITFANLPGSPTRSPASDFDANFAAVQGAPTIQAFGSAPGDGSDQTAAFLAAKAWIDARGGNATVLVPTGTYRLSQEIAVVTPQTWWRGEGQGTVIIPTFDGCPFPLGSLASPTTTQYARVTDMSFAVGVTSTAGGAFVFRGGSFLSYQRVLHQGFYRVGIFGDPSLPVANPGPALLRDISGASQHDGLRCYAGAGLTIDGTSIIEGNSIGGSIGIDIVAGLDGLFVGTDTIISGFSRLVYIHHTSGSVANIELRGSMANPIVAMIDVSLSGSATLHQFLCDGTRFFDVGSGSSADLLTFSNTGSGSWLEFMFWNIEAVDIGQSLWKLNAPITEITAGDIHALGLSAKSDGTYPAIDFGSQAHGHVVLNSARLGGNFGGTVRPSAGLANGDAILKAVISSIDASDAVTPYTNMYVPGNNLKLSNIVGTAL